MKKAYSLIEFAIVLVLLGLLAGTVLVGRSLIHAAQIRGVINQKEQFTLAANSFKLKYDNYLPGDIPVNLATRFGLYTFTGANAGGVGYGDGDGVVDSGRTGVAAGFIELNCTGECWGFWQHLSNAGLISGIGTGGEELKYKVASSGLPESKLHTGVFVVGRVYFQRSLLPSSYKPFYGDKPFFSVFPIAVALPSRAMPLFSPMEAHSIDAKMDDGMPSTGDVLMNQLDYGNDDSQAWWMPAATVGKCTHGGTDWIDPAAQYNLTEATGSEMISCMPLFRLN